MKISALVMTAAAILSASAPAIAEAGEGRYLGKASNGADVFYQHSEVSCGDLADNHPCWRSPHVLFTVGNDQVSANADCDAKVFRNVTVNGQPVKDITPGSKAFKLLLKGSCAFVPDKD
jgi:uncharacterized membrane protein (UPF0182 family)